MTTTILWDTLSEKQRLKLIAKRRYRCSRCGATVIHWYDEGKGHFAPFHYVDNTTLTSRCAKKGKYARYASE